MKSEFENWYSNSKDKSTSSAFAAGWMCQQSKIDELNCDINVQKEQLNKLDRVIDGYAIEVDELKCELKRINSWYSNVKLQLENKEIDSAIDAKKIDELQKENAALVHVIKSRDIQEKNELTKQRDSFIKAYEIEMDESVELQKRVDAALKILSSKKKMYVDMVIEVEQALKGGEACQ